MDGRKDGHRMDGELSDSPVYGNRVVYVLDIQKKCVPCRFKSIAAGRWLLQARCNSKLSYVYSHCIDVD